MTLTLIACGVWVACGLFLCGMAYQRMRHRCPQDHLYDLDACYKDGLADGLAARAEEIAELERMTRR